MLTQFDNTVEKYKGFDRIIKSVSKEDLEDMQSIGVDNYGKEKGKNTAIDIAVEWLNIMFIPDFLPDRQDTYSLVWKWEIFDNCGVYSILKHDVIIKYYLVERIYNFGIRFLLICLEQRSELTKIVH